MSSLMSWQVRQCLLTLVLSGKKLWKVRVCEPKFGLLILPHNTQINDLKIKDKWHLIIIISHDFQGDKNYLHLLAAISKMSLFLESITCPKHSNCFLVSINISLVFAGLYPKGKCNSGDLFEIIMLSLSKIATSPQQCQIS